MRMKRSLTVVMTTMSDLTPLSSCTSQRSTFGMAGDKCVLSPLMLLVQLLFLSSGLSDFCKYLFGVSSLCGSIRTNFKINWEDYVFVVMTACWQRPQDLRRGVKNVMEGNSSEASVPSTSGLNFSTKRSREEDWEQVSTQRPRRFCERDLREREALQSQFQQVTAKGQRKHNTGR